MERDEAGLGARAREREDENERGEPRRWMSIADVHEGVAPIRAGHETEGEQERKRAKTRHHQIDVAGANVVRIAVMRHHQRP